MDAITYNQAVQNLSEMMDRVCDDRAAVMITREAREAVVVMSLTDYKSMEETAFLLRNPKNAQRLLASIAELEAGKGTERELLD
jgi:antitoxin YefM